MNAGYNINVNSQGTNMLTPLQNLVTPLEEHVLNAQDFAAGLAAMGQLREMLEKSAECSAAMKDRELPNQVRIEALNESRRINQAFNIVAVARAACGISA